MKLSKKQLALYNLTHTDWLAKQVDKDMLPKKVYDQLRGNWESPIKSTLESVKYMYIDNRKAHYSVHMAANLQLTYKTKNSYNMTKATLEYQNTYDINKSDASAWRKGTIQDALNGDASMHEWLDAMVYATNGGKYPDRAGVSSFVPSEISDKGAYPLHNNLVAVDVDYNDLTPQALLDSSPFLQTFCAAIIPTPSYGFNGNYAVRLLFVLDDAEWISKIKNKNNHLSDDAILTIIKDTYTAIGNGLTYYVEQACSTQNQTIDIDHNLTYNPSQVVRIGRGPYTYNESAQLINAEQMVGLYRDIHKDKLLAFDAASLDAKIKAKNEKREAFYAAWSSRKIKDDALYVLLSKSKEIEDTWRWRMYMDVVGMCYYADVLTEEQGIELIKNVSYSEEYKNAAKYLQKAHDKQMDGVTGYEDDEIGLWLLLAHAKQNRLISEDEVFDDKRDISKLARDNVMIKSYNAKIAQKQEITMDYQNYLSDLTPQIVSVLDCHNRILINSKPGSGKSTFAMGLLKNRTVQHTPLGAMTYHILAYPSVQHVEAIREEYGYDSRIYASTPTLQNEDDYSDEQLIHTEIKYLSSRKYHKDIHAARMVVLSQLIDDTTKKQKMATKAAEHASLNALHDKIDADSDKYPHTHQDAKYHITSNHVNGKFADAVQARYAKGAYIFVTTYDSVDIVRDTISQYNPSATLDLLFIDECHLITMSYDFRQTAINTLLRVSSGAKKTIYLTGTAEHVHHDLYDASIVTTHNGAPNRVVAQNFEILKITNDNGAVGAIADLAQYVKDELTQKHGRVTQQVLLYLENKEYHHILAHFLDEMGITYIMVNADSKSQKVVKRFLRDKNTNAQVIIATTAIAESVSILNKNENYNTIIYNNLTSKIDSAAVIYQMASRYRNPYHTLTYMRSECADEKIENVNDVNYQNRNQGFILPFLDLVEGARDNAQYVADYLTTNVPKNAYKDVIEYEYGVHITRSFASDDIFNKSPIMDYAVNAQRVHYLAYAKQLQQAQINKITNDYKIAAMIGLDINYNDGGTKNAKKEKEIEETKQQLASKKEADRIAMADLMSSDTYGILYHQIKSHNVDDNDAVDKLIGMGVYYDYAKLIVAHRYLPYRVIPDWIRNASNNKAINRYKNELKAFDSILQYKNDAQSMTIDVIVDFLNTYQNGLHKYDKDGNITESNPFGQFIHPHAVDALVDNVAKKYENLKYDKKTIKKILDEYLVKDTQRVQQDGKRVRFVSFRPKNIDYFVDFFKCETKRQFVDIYIQYRLLINGEDDYYIKLARDYACTLPTTLIDYKLIDNQDTSAVDCYLTDCDSDLA